MGDDVENDNNWGSNKKLVVYQISELNEAVGSLEDKVNDWITDLSDKMNEQNVTLIENLKDLEIKMTRKSAVAGAITGLGSSCVVAAASLVAIFKKGS